MSFILLPPIFPDMLPAQSYKLGDPTDSDINLGPVVSLASAERIRKQIADAGAKNFHAGFCFFLSNSLCSTVAAGAKELVPGSHFPIAKQ